MADDTAAKETRIVIFGLIGLAVLIVGYCGVKAVQYGRQVTGMAQRMDTFHVQDGSAVYLDKVSIAPLTRVIVIHGDTGQATPRNVTAALNREMAMYTAGAPTDSAVSARVAAMQTVYGLMGGRYDGADPVHIDLEQGTPPNATLPDGMLKIPGRQVGIPLYRAPKP